MHQIAISALYSADMNNRPLTKLTFAKNLKMLMDLTGMKTREISERSGVSPRMIKYLLDAERTASIEIAEQIGEAFGLTGWQMIMPQLSDEISELKHLSHLVSDWALSDKDGKTYIEATAKRESSRH